MSKAIPFLKAGVMIAGLALAPFTGGMSLTIAAGINIALMGAEMILAPKPKKGLTGGITATRRNPTAYRRILYGQRRVGGTVVYLDSRWSSNDLLDLVIVLAGHQIEEISQMWFGDELAWDKDTGAQSPFQYTFSDGLGGTREFHLGTPGDPASPYLLANSPLWTNTHKLSGCAYVVLSLRYGPDVYPNGIPNITFILKGKNDIFDPRDSSTGYTANPALCIRDYLTNDYFGLGASEIDDASFITGANLADEDVNLDAGGTENRYECHGVLDTNIQHGAAIESLLTSMGARITFTGGKFRLVNPEYNAPTLTLDETHARGPIQVQTRRSRRDTFTGVRGVFASATDNWVEADYPPIISSTFSEEDGEPIYKDLPLPFTTSASMAQRLAKVALLQGRSQITAVIPMNLAAMELVPGDTVAVTNERFGWESKVFEVQSWSFVTAADGALGVDLALSETSAAIFDWETSEEQEHIAGIPTNLPSGFTITAPGLAISEEDRTEYEDVITVMIIDATSSDQFFESVEVEYKLSSESTYRAAGRAASTRFEVLKVAAGSTYDIRARVRSVTGVLSDYTTTSYAVNGGSTPPPDVTGLTASPAGPHTALVWTPVDDLRLSHYIVRHTPRTSAAAWESATVIVPKVARPASSVTVASRPGTYLVKAVNKKGLLSTNAATILSPVAGTDGLNVVSTITENPGFSGAKTNVVVDGSDLKLSGTPFESSGTYEFASVVDLSAIYTSRVFANIKFSATGGAGSWDALVGNWDDQPGLWDDLGTGDAPGLAAWLEMATTRDDPGGSPAWTAWAQLGVHEVEARGLKFRAQLTTEDTEASPLISVLEVTIDMPDRVESGQDVQSGTDAGGDVIVFGAAFNATPAIGIGPQDMAQGDFFTLEAKASTGFTVRFKNSGGTVIDVKYDWDAKGYGTVLT